LEVRGGARSGETVFPDFTDPRVRKWWGGRYGDLLAQGFAGVCHDRNEPASPPAFGDAPPRAPRHDLEGRGGDHHEAHNVYALAMAKAGYLGLLEQRPELRPFLLSRAGWAGSQRYGGVAPGAAVTDWAGLRASLALVLGLGLCGVPYSGPDFSGGPGSPSPELFLRSFQLATHLPLFRGRPSGRLGARGPWAHGAEVLDAVRAAAARRERLLPFFVTLAHLAQRTGAPYVRPLWWHHFQDRALRDCDDAFLLGDALLVAPVLEPGVHSRRVRLPRGCWYDTATGVRYRGGRTVSLEAPLDRLPVLARAGAAIPVAADAGGLELEVWSPPPGRTGAGLLVRESGDGWGRPPVERLTVRLVNGRAEVSAEDGRPVDLPLRVRG
jgi:alpha-glucosidase